MGGGSLVLGHGPGATHHRTPRARHAGRLSPGVYVYLAAINHGVGGIPYLVGGGVILIILTWCHLR